MRCGKALHKIRRKQPHVSGQAHQIDLIFPQRRHHLAIVSFALQALGRNHPRRDSSRLRALNSLRALAIGDDDRDFRVGNAPGGNAVRQRLKIRAAPA